MGTIYNILQKNSAIEYYNHGDIIIGENIRQKSSWRKCWYKMGWENYVSSSKNKGLGVGNVGAEGDKCSS